jgi:transcriptional regulator with XRE-family HTH domain
VFHDRRIYSLVVEKENALLQLIGHRVAQRRSELALSLDMVAERTGVSRAMVSRIERGEVHASAVVLDATAAPRRSADLARPGKPLYTPRRRARQHGLAGADR